MLDIAIITIYLAAVLIIGIRAGRHVKSIEEFSVAGRSFSYLVIFATLSASFIGGGFSMGNSEKVFLFGLVNIFALWGFSMKEILVAQFIAPQIKRYDAPITVGDIMGHHYGKGAKVVTGIFSVILCSGILGAQVGAMGYIFNIFLGLDQMYGIIIGLGIVIAYSTIGGMRAIVYTDILQFIVLMVGLPLVLIFGVVKAGGVGAVIQAVPVDHLTFLGPYTLLAFLSLFFTFVIGEALVPPYVQRLFIAKDVNEVRKGTMLSGLFSIPFLFVTGSIGLVALVLFPEIDANLAMPTMIKEVLPIGLIGIVIAGVISIVMSSADSFLNGASVAAVHDVIKPLMNTDDEKNFRLVKIINILVGILAIVFAIKIKSILDILIYSYNFWAPIIVVPLVVAILGGKVTKTQFYWGMTGGIIGVVGWNFVLDAPFGIDGLIIGVIGNALLFTLGRFFPR
ncbi:MAG: sodium:solute symporter family protein [Nitrospina sp.]|nr:MAG: sodium:solute symporter family protein [Nitrospina sp.]